MDGPVDARRITIHAPEDFSGMRAAGRLAAETLDMIVEHVRPGVSTGTLDRLCHEFILAHNAVPAPLNYRGYPKSICTSINHVVCHGIPGDKKLQNGDILNIDVTVILEGWHGDTNRMFYVGDVGVKARRLCDVTYEAMMRGIRAAVPGREINVIGRVIQSYARRFGYGVVRDFTGHGIGTAILEQLVQDARALGLSRLFCLTFETEFFGRHGFAPIEGQAVSPEVYAELLRSYDEGVAEFLDLERVKPNTLGNTRMLRQL